MRIYQKIIMFLMVIIYSQFFLGSYSNSCSLYRDPFGPLQTGWTMGDLIRYTVTPNINIYNGLVLPPLGASDIKSFGKNTYNLYNALGYLYAGWASLNYSNTSQSDWVGSFRQQGGDPFSGNPQKALVNFDNNVEGKSTIHFPMNSQDSILNNVNYLVGTATITSGDATNSFSQPRPHYYTSGAKYYLAGSLSNANASCGWCPNPEDGNFIIVFGNDISYPKVHQTFTGIDNDRLISNGYVYPCGQFFGARIAHILGAVVNDVPWYGDTIAGASGGTDSAITSLTGASGGTGSAITSLIGGPVGKGTLVPMLAVMTGSAYAITGSGATATSNTPAGMFQPSTAHFGSIQTFLNKLQSSNAVSTKRQISSNHSYLINHLQPTVSYLSTVASYKISTNSNTLNLIEIEDDNISPYGNGVIVAIQNNTGDQLDIKQVTSQGSAVIGSLDAGNNNYFLHTASLMPNQLSAPSGSSGSSSSTGTATAAPDQNHMISIIDTKENNISAYIQILDATQLQALVGAINTTLASVTVQGSPLPALNYNQITAQNYAVPTDSSPSYVVVTNFNPSMDSNNSLSSLDLPQDDVSKAQILNSFRIQAVNVAEFYNQPYFLTLQINKEHVGYGIQTNYETDSSGNNVINAQGNYVVSGYSLSKGSPNSYILYPSIVSSNVCTWQNLTHVVSGNNGYSSIPLLMIPDAILNPSNTSLKIPGLQAYYIIWLMSYAAAMTECSYNQAAFGDIFGVYDKVFNLFQSSNNKFTFQGSATKQISRVIVDQNQNLLSGHVLELANGISICGCDTWDSGGGFNQDIPILNLPSATEVNKSGQDYVNLKIEFAQFSELEGEASFNKLYCLPYSTMALFSLPTASLKDGVTLKVTSDPAAGMYTIIIKDKQSNVLAAPKIYLDKNLMYKNSSIVIDFLRTPGDENWKDPQSLVVNNKAGLVVSDVISESNQQISFANNLDYSLQYVQSDNKNTLVLKNLSQDSISNNEDTFIANLLKDPSTYTVNSIDMKNQSLDSFSLGFNGGTTIYDMILQKNINGSTSQNNLSLDISSATEYQSDFKMIIIPVNTDYKVLYNNGSFNENIYDSRTLSHFRVYVVDNNNNVLTNTYFKLPIPPSNQALFSGSFMLYSAQLNDTAVYIELPNGEKQYFGYPALNAQGTLPENYLIYVYVAEFKNVKVSPRPQVVMPVITPQKSVLLTKGVTAKVKKTVGSKTKNSITTVVTPAVVAKGSTAKKVNNVGSVQKPASVIVPNKKGSSLGTKVGVVKPS